MIRLEEQPPRAILFRFWVFYCFIFYGSFPLFPYEFELILTKIMDSMILLKSKDIPLHVTMVFKSNDGSTDHCAIFNIIISNDALICYANNRFCCWSNKPKRHY